MKKQTLSFNQFYEKPQKSKSKRREGKRGRKFPLRAFAVVAVAAFVAATIIFALPMLPQQPAGAEVPHYKGVAELWNIETFEGGYGSRSSWLLRCAAKFEKSKTGAFVHVTNLTYQQAKQKLEEGETFDMACFSFGTGEIVLPYLTPYTGKVADVFDNLLASATVDGKLYALPIYAGTYCLFAREEQLKAVNADILQAALSATLVRKVGKNTVTLAPLVAGFNAFNSPLSALAAENVKGAVNVETISQYSAYEKFVANRTAVTLLGTQRDLFRLQQRRQNGKIEQLASLPLCGYTDLVQYVGVAKGKNAALCMDFAEYLASPSVQCTVREIGMFPVTPCDVYSDETYVACQKAVQFALTPNAFSTAVQLAELRKTAVECLRGA